MGWRVDSDLQQMLRESAQGYLADKGGPTHFRSVRASDTGIDGNAWKEMAELGWTGILLPESAGGSELGLEPALTIAEEMGRAISPEPFVASAVIAATVLAAAEGDAAASLAQTLATGERTVTLAWQEQTGALGLPDFTTRFAGGTLSGRKCHVPAWHEASALLVAAGSEDGPVVIALEPGASGITASARRMTDGSFSAELVFDNVTVPEDAMILQGDAARDTLALALARGTIALSAQLEGLSGALWQMTLDYMKQRVQFGQPLSDFQALRHRMADLYGSIELAAASWRAAHKALEEGQIDSVSLHAAKARCSDVAMEMSRWAIQYHGAIGYTEEADVGLYVNSALRWASWLGNATAHRRAALATHCAGGAQ